MFVEKIAKETLEVGYHLAPPAGGWLPAARSLRACWKAEFGDNLEGIFDFELDGSIDKDLLIYWRHVAASGAAARQPTRSTRFRSKPHRSALDHIGEAYEKSWEDAHRGRVLLSGTASDEFLHGVVSSPWGRVAKLNPDRTVSAEGRFIHDQRTVNVTGSKYDHPPALQPKHAVIAKRVLWWKVRHPGVEGLIAKRDIAEAFRWIWLKESDCGLFATELPGKHVGVEPRL